MSFGLDPVGAIDSVAPRLANVHISDAREKRYRGGILNGLFRDHLAPGAGDVDLSAIADRLHHHGYTGLVTLELSPVSLRAYWPWAPVRFLTSAREELLRCGFGDGLDASAGASSQRQVR
jgi:sugar phosphate isomerase/epimerase